MNIRTALLLTLPVFSSSILTSCQQEENQQAAAPAPQVQYITPLTQDITTYIEHPATLEGQTEVDIHARVSGILSLGQGVEPFDGEIVQQGDPLFLIEPETYAQRRAAAEAVLQRAQATLANAENQYQRLSQIGSGVAQLDVDNAQAAVAEAEASVAEAEAQLQSARIQESYTAISAPISGRISRPFIDPGNLVGNNGSAHLATIVDESTMLAYFEVPERQLLDFLDTRDDKTRQESYAYNAAIRLKLADGSTYPHDGQIDYVDNQIDSSTRTARVRARFPNPDAQLASGLYGLIGFPIGPNPQDPHAREGILIPTATIQQDLAGSYVWVIQDDNTIRRQSVQTGAVVSHNNSDHTVITDGIQGNEKIVSKGIQRVRGGLKVQAEAEQKSQDENS